MTASDMATPDPSPRFLSRETPRMLHSRSFPRGYGPVASAGASAGASVGVSAGASVGPSTSVRVVTSHDASYDLMMAAQASRASNTLSTPPEGIRDIYEGEGEVTDSDES